MVTLWEYRGGGGFRPGTISQGTISPGDNFATLEIPKALSKACFSQNVSQFSKNDMKSDADDPVTGAEGAGFFFKASTGTGAFVIAPGPAQETQCLQLW